MASRGIWQTLSARKRRGLALSWSALFVLSLLLQYFSFAIASPVAAVHNDGLFELDKNAVQSTTHDWDQVYADSKNHTSTAGADQIVFKTDPINSVAAEHLFTGGNTKDGIDISSWKWTSGPGVQDKNDISNAYAAAYTKANGDSIVYFGQDRYAQNGDAFVGFWFLKNAVSEKAGGTFNGVHADGDVLVQVNFTNGGTISTFLVSDWQNGALHSVSPGADCAAAGANDDVCGVVNASEIDSPWPYTPKSGTADKIPAGGFFEAGINLTAFGLDQGCFSTFIAETRSSQPLTSTLSDYAMGGFSFCVGADINTQVKHNGTSTGDNGHIAIGQSVTDTATITGTKGTPTGTVDFFVCGPSNSAPDCSSNGTKVGATKTLSSGAATSDAFTPDAVGSYCFRVEYTPAAGSKYLAGSHTNTTSECFVVDKLQPAISTSANETVSAGTEISDQADLTGATSDAGGTIVFKAYGPSDANCSKAPAFTSSAIAVSGNGTYPASPVSFTPATAGTYHWIASYSGDAKNLPVAGACGDAGENDTVNKLTPTIATQASADVVIGASISDTATVSGGLNPSGTVTFRLYGPNDATCATVIFTSANRPLTNGQATSESFTPTAVGTYRWIATYNGDANNNVKAGSCDDANESVVVSKTTPGITTNLVSGALSGTTISVALGASVHDTSSLSNVTADAGGTVHYQVFTNSSCTGTAIDAGTKTVTNGIVPASDSITLNNAGNYYWQADYSGDAKNGSASSNCSLEIASVGLNQPRISTNASASVLVGGKIHDTATLADGFNPTGTITFRLYGPNDATCSKGAIFTDAVSVNGNGDYTSADFTTSQAGTYFWVATYGGDSNNAAAAGACGDANESVIVTIPNLHAVKLVKTNGGSFGPTSTAMPGDVLTYQITVTNSGNGDALNVPVSDDISAILAHATYNNDCSNGCSFGSNTLSWTIPSIAKNGGSVVLTFSVTLDSTFPTGTTHLPNVVVVTGPGSNCAASSADPDCDTDTTVATSILGITKSFTGNTNGTDPDLHVPSAKVGDTLHYTLAYHGEGDLTNAVITDVLPVGLDYVAGSAKGDSHFTFDSYNATTRTLTWKSAVLLDPAQAGTNSVDGAVTYDVKVLATAPDQPQPLVNTATIRSDQTEPDSDIASVAVLAPPLALTPPPTDTLTPQTATGNPGQTLMLILLGVAGLALGVGFVTPVPERARRRDRNR